MAKFVPTKLFLSLIFAAFVALMLTVAPLQTRDVHAQSVVQTSSQDQIVHNFSCYTTLYYEYYIPKYPGVLTINFIQATASGNIVTDHIYVNVDPNKSGYFYWKLASTGDVSSGPVGSSYWGVYITTYPDFLSGQSYYVASICSTWSTDGQSVLSY
jgi:hypothetical protein